MSSVRGYYVLYVADSPMTLGRLGRQLNDEYPPLVLSLVGVCNAVMKVLNFLLN